MIDCSVKYLGIDIGSISICVVVINENKEILLTRYIRHQGAPELNLKKLLIEINSEKGFSCDDIGAVAFTGTGGKRPAELLCAGYVNEIIATATGLVEYFPQTESAIEMGGQGSKYYLIKDKILADFSTSGLCAAGTGSFLDHQAARLKVNIENEFGKLALKSVNPPHIAGRCSVFAKSDMIHHQQIGTSDYDIIAGLCYAVARNYKSTILKKKKLVKPVVFIGGVSLNVGVVKSIKDELGLNDEELIVPEYNLYYGALGAAIKEKEKSTGKCSINIDVLDRKGIVPKGGEPLVYVNTELKHYDKTNSPPKITSDVGYLGVDVGSLSTNLVVIDTEGRVMARRYLMTEGRPIKTVQRGLKEIARELDGRVRIAGVGTTGSGRYLIGDILGADVVRNEITAQAKAAVFFDPEVDTIFEIGGQDSKYISLDNGIVVDFEMNKACAAGTGSFLQEQAERLDISIEEQFGNMALKSKCPIGCGERCTVFIESDIVSHQQQGATREDIVAGLAYSIVKNYLNKVVGKKRIGNKIFFQGGVAWNKGVVAAFERVTGKKVTVPPHHDITGAIGIAFLAKENGHMQTRFKGFGVADVEFVQESFVCTDCPNVCTIRKITGDGNKNLYYGSRCGKYDTEAKNKGSRSSSDNPVAWRNQFMFSYGNKNIGKTKGVIGIPRLLINWSLWPLWVTFFNELGFKVVSSTPTNNTIIREGSQSVGSETCFPVKVAHGHILNLLSRNPDYIFLPSIINFPSHQREKTESYTCPYVQSIPYLAKAAVGDRPEYSKVLSPSIYFGYGERLLKKQIVAIGKTLGCSKKQTLMAFESARNAYKDFKLKLLEKGKEYLSSSDIKKLVLVGRPYNTCDPGLNLDLPKKITGLGALCLPPDMVPVESKPVDDSYWHYGKSILRIAEYVKNHDDIFPVYITNFGCGPDSFIIHDFAHILKGKPFLQLELDEHSADAGLITRCEAFLDSIRSLRVKVDKPEKTTACLKRNVYNRKLYIPRMSDIAEIFKSALTHYGLEAEVMAESDDITLELGRKYTNGKECYPAVLTTGDLIRLVNSPGFIPEKSAFFMPAAGGPCRFGQYHRLHRRLLDELGFQDVPILSPDSGDSYNNFLGNMKGFRKLAWRGFIFGDNLFKLYLMARARVNNTSIAEKIFKEGFKAGCDDIAGGGTHLRGILDEYGRMLSNLDNGRKAKVKIGLVGEIYIRNNRFSNNYLVSKLEKCGAEVYMASFVEWIDYTTYMYKMNSAMRNQYLDYVKAILTDMYQHHEMNKIIAPVTGLLDGNSEKPVATILSYSTPYLSRSVGGEAILTIGKAIDFVQSGCGGIVNCMPFTCMPGNITQGLSTKVSADLDGVPWLNIAFEGPGDPTEDLKIEAFVNQASQWQSRKKK